MKFSVQIDREADGCWIAEIPEVPGAMAYGKDQQEAIGKAYAIALRTVADSIEQSKEDPPNTINLVRASA